MEPTTPPPQPAGRLCEIRQTEKKGLGLYAKVDIAEATIISEEISVRFDLGEYKFSAATWENPEFWEDIRNYRVRPVEDAVSGLIAMYKDDAFVQTVASQLSRSLSVPGLSDHANLFFTNCQPLEVTSPPISIFFGPITCAFNHSCIGNATFNSCGISDSADLVTNVVAIKPIKAGTEITVSYTILPFLTAQRRLTLRELYRFECVCKLCMDVTPETIESFAKVNALMKEIEAPIERDNKKQKTPWVFFKSALEVAEGYRKLEIKDMRCAVLWEQCASVAAYHSDELRTHYCLLWAAQYWNTLGSDRRGALRHPEEEDLAEKEKLAEQKRAELLAELDEEEEKKKKKEEPAAVPIKKAKKKRSKKQNGRKGAAGGAEKGSEEAMVPAPPDQVVRLNVVEDREQIEASRAGWEEVGAKKRPH
ncbi:hypothetical protein EPUS_01645 [Endocarpon pusillum Z07020]|uniref:SET domain-containing protein n=1 Tax=Endocarpon pusillum (strain Z07020 / HMAS-L-300199) TaxID=1263415 RepID=U1HY87_ENDPU|nr:uncharacterized protein EPUS_01645 [Endocarpon pusillum Z07020]ERF75815.1 hypothetical protein EPUS_01645 [Endocarpon pusillum Z07020]